MSTLQHAAPTMTFEQGSNSIGRLTYCGCGHQYVGLTVANAEDRGIPYWDSREFPQPNVPEGEFYTDFCSTKSRTGHRGPGKSARLQAKEAAAAK